MLVLNQKTNTPYSKSLLAQKRKVGFRGNVHRI